MWKGSFSYAICRLVDWHACITASNLEDILLRFPIVIKRLIYCLFLQVELVDSYTGRLPFECTVYIVCARAFTLPQNWTLAASFSIFIQFPSYSIAFEPQTESLRIKTKTTKIYARGTTLLIIRANFNNSCKL